MRRFRRTLLPALTAITLSLKVTSCGADSDTGSADKVKFGYIADYNGASLLAIADKEGLWDKHGLDPEISVFTNGPVQIQALGAGDLDFGYIGPGAFWLPASGKAKIVAIDTLTVADRVVAQPGIDSVRDLKGKKVGVPEGTSGDMVLNLALRQAGMSIDDVDKVPMDPALPMAGRSGNHLGCGVAVADDHQVEARAGRPGVLDGDHLGRSGCPAVLRVGWGVGLLGHLDAADRSVRGEGL